MRSKLVALPFLPPLSQTLRSAIQLAHPDRVAARLAAGVPMPSSGAAAAAMGSSYSRPPGQSEGTARAAWGASNGSPPLRPPVGARIDRPALGSMCFLSGENGCARLSSRRSWRVVTPLRLGLERDAEEQSLVEHLPNRVMDQS